LPSEKSEYSAKSANNRTNRSAIPQIDRKNRRRAATDETKSTFRSAATSQAYLKTLDASSPNSAKNRRFPIFQPFF
jgi:hypothetical protein